MNSLADQRRRIRRTAIAIAVTMAIVIGSVAVAATVSDAVRSRMGITGSSSAPTGADLDARKRLTLKAKVLQGPLIPGITRPLQVTITNPLSQQVSVTSVTVKAGTPKAQGCQASWFKATSFKATKKKKPIKVKARGKAKVTLSITMTNLSSVNQDACKSTQVPLKLQANAKQS